MEKDLISVIVPVYNAGAYLERSIASILSQTYTNLQILIIDDCSTDNTISVINDMKANDARIEVFHFDVNKGVSAARNYGIAIAKGKYIYFADGDDILEKDCVEFLHSNILIDNRYGMSICGFFINDRPYCKKQNVRQELSAVQTARAISSMNGSAVKGYLWNKLFIADVIKNNGVKFDEACYVCEDTLFCQQYVQFISKAIYDSTAKYHYFQRKTSAVHSGIGRRKMSAFKSYNKICSLVEMYGDQELDKCVKANYWSYAIKYYAEALKIDTAESRECMEYCLKIIKDNTFGILFSRYISIKRKGLLLLTCIRNLKKVKV